MTSNTATILTLLVRSMTREANDVMALDLVAPDGVALPPWQPGAHIDLTTGNGITRQYSLCGDTSDPYTYRVAVLNEPVSQGGSRYVHEVLRPGDTVGVRGPRNNFRFEPAAEHVFLAGGIGITPILPMLEAAEAAASSWKLFYGGRSRSSMAFTAELERYGDRVALLPQEETGLIDLAKAIGAPRAGTLVYCCGPAPLLDAATRYCAGWPEDALRTERFAAVQAQHQTPRGAFEVELARTGSTVTVPPEHSILQTLLEEGIELDNDCREGICGSCELKVLAGEPEHRDHVLTQRERREGATMMICVSRARSQRLVLDA